MSMTMQIDSRQFQSAVRDYLKWNQREESMLVNKIAKDVAMQAIGRTVKANKDAIKSQLEANGLKYKIIKARAYDKGESLTQREVELRARKLVNARRRSVGYIASGWFKALSDLGFPRNFNPRSKIAYGYARKAMPKTSPLAIIANASTGASKVGQSALLEAIRFKTRDLMQYIENKINEGNKRFFQ